jgi:hypothetical protein
MKHRLRVLAVVLAAVTLSGSALAGPLRADHPLLGTWRFTLPDGSCTEVYTFKADGTADVTSGEEVSSSAIEFSDQPTDLGYYKWVDKILKNNGKKDCGGSTTPIGHVATNYIRLHPSGNKLLFCESENLDVCLGPVNRVP